MIQKKVYTGKIKPNIGLLVVLLVMISFGCADREQGTTHSGELVSVEFEHRNVVEHRGEGGPEISLLIIRGRTQGTIPDGGITLHYRVDSGSFQQIEMYKTASGRRYLGQIPPQQEGSLVDYYIRIEHRRGKILTFPKDAEAGEYYTIHIR